MFTIDFMLPFECMSSIGSSLQLEDMTKSFLKTFIKVTAASSGKCWKKSDGSLISAVNEKHFIYDINDFELTYENEFYKILKFDDDVTIIILSYKDIVCAIRFNIDLYSFNELASMFFSFSKKINSSVDACNIFKEHKDIKDRFQLAIDGANDGIWDWNIITNEVFFSIRWKSMLGYKDDEIKNDFNEWSSRVHPDDLDKVLEDIHSHFDKKVDIFENIHRMKHKNGKWIWILDRGKALFVDGKPIRMVGFHTDITNQKELEESLEKRVQEEIEKNKEKDKILQQQTRLAQMGEMISMIAHQWRQPLASISSSAITIKLKIMLNKFDLTKKEELDEFIEFLNIELDDIESLVENLTTTIDDFRDFYKPNKEKKVLNIDKTIEKSLTIIKSQINNSNIELIKNYESVKQIVLFDSELMQVFLNIFKNAHDNFMQKNIKNPTIEIFTQDIKDGVLVKILDNGGGIDNSIIDKIFDPYFSTKDEKNGTGLGLYMSKTIIEKHHKGSIKVANIKDGVCFTIEIKDLNNIE